MARKRPKFLGRVGEIFKDSFLRGDSGLGGSGRFLAMGRARKLPHFNLTFCKDDSKLEAHLDYKSWPQIWRGSGLWIGLSGLAGEPIWTASLAAV